MMLHLTKHLTPLLIGIIFFCCPNNSFSQRYWVSTTTGNWSGDNWSSTSGGAPDGGGPPTAGVDAIFNANGLGDCNVDIAANFDGINTSNYTGTIDLNGNTFSISGINNCTFQDGVINDTPGTSTLQINTTGQVRFSGTTFGVAIDATGSIDFDGGTFNNAVVVNHGYNNRYGAGDCTFNSSLTINNSSDYEIRLGQTNPDTFNGTVTLDNSGSSWIRLAYNSAGNSFNDDIFVSTSGSASGISFGQGGIGSADFGVGVNLAVGTDFTIGDLILESVNQTDATNIALDLNGTARAYLENSLFLGDLDVQAPRVFLKENTFDGSVYFEKEGASNDQCYGGNTFNGDAQLHLTGSGYFLHGNSSDDIWNGDLTLTNEGTDILYVAHNSGGNQFNGNIILECTSSNGIRFCQGSSGAATIVAGKSISLGSLGFTDGVLYLTRVTQTGATAQNLDLSGNARLILDECTFDGDLTFSSPRFQFSNSTFNGAVQFTKEDASTDNNVGGNIFNGTTSFQHDGSNDWYFGSTNPDIFNGATSFSVTGDATARMLLSNSSTGNEFNDDVTFENVNAGGIYVGPSNGTTTLAAGKTIQIGGLGFTDGILYLFNLTQSDATPISLNPTGTTLTYLSNSTFLGDLSIVTPRILVQVNSFSGTVLLEKTGATNDDSNGGNTFNASTTLTNSGSARILMGNANPDVFNDDLYVNNTGTDNIYLAHNSTGNQFNGNIELVNTTGNSIRFSQGSSGTSILGNGQTITVGAGGFTNGSLYLFDFTQSGTTSQNLSLDNTANLYMTDAVWEGDLTASSGYLETDYSTYEKTAQLDQTGSNGNSSSSGNDFQDNAILNNSGGNNFAFGVTDPDNFQGDLELNNSGSANSYIAYNSTGNVISGNLTLTNSGSGSGVYVGYSNTTTSFTVGGNVTLTESSSTNSTNAIANNGTGSIGGDLSITNNSTATNCYTYLTNGSASQLTIDGLTTLTNNGAANNNQEIRVAWSGTAIFNQTVTVVNNSSASGSYIRFAYSSGSVATFNDDIILENTVAGGQGISFGENGGSSELAANKTVTTGSGGFVDGTLRFRNFTQNGPTAQSLTLTGSAYLFNQDSDWGGDISFIAPRHRTDGTTYRGTAYLEKTGGSNDNSAGGNYFYDVTELVHSGSDNFLFGNGSADSCDADLTISNTGDGNFYFAYNSSDNYINGNLAVTNDVTGGNLIFSNQTGSTIEITGNASILNNSSNSTGLYFPDNGNIDLTGDLTITDNGSSGNMNFYVADNPASVLNIGGNVDIELNTSGTTGRFYFGDQGTITVEGNCDFSNSSTCTNSEFYVSNGANASTTFNGDITLENYGSGSDGFYFGNSSGASTLASGKTVTIGPNGFNTGRAQFRNFTQLGNTAQSMTLTGDAYFYNVESSWGGDVIFVAPRMRTDNTTYSGTAYLEKSGGVGDDQSQGNNSFAGDATIVNSGSEYFMMGDNNPDTFDGNVILNNTGSDNIYLAYSSTGNTIAGDLTINQINSSNVTIVCSSSSSTLDVSGNTDITFSTSNANTALYFPNGGTIAISGNLIYDQSTTGSTSNSYLSSGSNASLTVDGSTTITNNSTSATTGRIYLGNNGNITLNGTLDIINNSTATNAECYVNSGSNSSGIFNGNITLESAAVSDGVRFGASGGSAVLSDGYTITVGAGGFEGSYLELRNFTQLGNTAQNITTTGTATQINMRDAIWNADADFEGARIFLRESTFEGVTNFTKTGAYSDASVGGNVFNDDVTFDNASTNEFRLSGSNGYPDDFNAAVTFIESGSGEMRPSYNNSDTYAGDINLNSASQIYFNVAGNGRVILDGNTDQNITDLVGGVLHRMRDLEVSKTGGDVYLSTSFEILNELELNQGIVYSDASNLIEMTDNSTVTAVSNASHIDGPIDKTGNDAFTFPVGDNGFYRPIAMSNPASGSAEFRAQYNDIDPSAAGYNDTQMDATLTYISDCEYWTLDRLSTSNNVSVSLSYDTYSGSCSGVNDPATVSVARWDGSKWRDHGNDGSATPGWIVSSSAVTSFSPFALSTDNYPTNPLPIELLLFQATAIDNNLVQLDWQTASEINNDYFTLERSSDGIEFLPIENIDGAGNSTQVISYMTNDRNPLKGVSYYRLKQTDFNGDFTYSNIAAVEISEGSGMGVIVFPNPVSTSEEGLTILFDEAKERKIEIINQIGQTIDLPTLTSDIQLNLSTASLSKGVYFLKIMDDSETHTERIVVK